MPGAAVYSRLFGQRFASHDEPTLAALAATMRSERSPIIRQLPSGFVYLGQFSDHDLTSDSTRLGDAGSVEPAATINHRTPRLHLDSVYGAGPEGEPEIYDHSTPGRERFRIDQTEPSDLPRRADGSAIVPEERNDENRIVSQLHVLFLKFHNRLVDLLDSPGSQNRDLGPPTGSVFAKARRFVTWHYQWLLLHQFLPRVILQDTWSELVRPGYQSRIFDPPINAPPALPVEFTIAAYRFGHSMVRSFYRFNDHCSVRSLTEVLNAPARPLRSDEVIEWERFFGGTTFSKINFAHRLDTQLVPEFFALPERLVSLYLDQAPQQILSLAHRTLLRGSRVGLPSGQEALAILDGNGITLPRAEFQPTNPHFDFLRDSGIAARTPLWYYLLHEASRFGTNARGADRASRGGECLGPLGSLIVGEVLLAALRCDEQSYLHVQPAWRPDEINSFPKLAAFAQSGPA